MTQKPLIHFAHANGIPSKTYQKLFDLLSDDYDVVYIPILSAHKGYSADNNWTELADQIIHSIEQQANGRKVIGLGHSLGSLSTFLASYKRPDLFEQIIMLDPPMFVGFKSFVLDMAKIFAPWFVDKVTPAGLSKNRRDTWDSREQAYQQLRNKTLFKKFDEQCFQDYIDHGLIDTAQGDVTLAIPVASEVAVFRNNPSRFWLPMQKPLVPAQQINGADSPFVEHKFPMMIKKKIGMPYTIMQGGHMFPLEHPEDTVALIKKLLQQVN